MDELQDLRRRGERTRGASLLPTSSNLPSILVGATIFLVGALLAKIFLEGALQEKTIFLLATIFFPNHVFKARGPCLGGHYHLLELFLL